MNSDTEISKRSQEERYEILVADVGRAIDEADPIGLLGMGCPPDEHSPEIGTVVPRVSKASSAEEIKHILHEEFSRWFGEGTAGPEEAYEAPSVRVWAAVTRFRQSA